jgi:transposase-like protein
VGLKPLPELNPTSCPECASPNIVKVAEEPRQPIVMKAAWSNYPQTPGDMATQTWRCSGCGHEWVAVETYPPEQP